MGQLKFIPYQPKYLEYCIELFKSNLTGYFSTSEELDFRAFLGNLSKNSHYYIGLKDNKIIACGGWECQEKGCYLRWGIIDHSHHKLGLGTKLLEFRINKIVERYGPIDISIKTSDKAHGFYKKCGFQVAKIVPDGIAEGIDEYQMMRPANKCVC